MEEYRALITKFKERTHLISLLYRVDTQTYDNGIRGDRERAAIAVMVNLGADEATFLYCINVFTPYGRDNPDIRIKFCRGKPDLSIVFFCHDASELYHETRKLGLN